MLCLHGWLDNAASFAPLAAELQDVHLIALELPGHGHSDHLPPGVPYHAVDSVVRVLDAAAVLGLERFMLMGHSMGAGVACLLAGAFPDKVSKLVLLDGLGPRSIEADGSPGLLQEYRAAQLQGRRPSLGRGASMETAVRARLSGGYPVSEASARLLVARGTRPVEGGFVFRADKRLRYAGPARMDEQHIRAFLAQIRSESLLVMGSEGLMLGPAVMRERVALIPGLRTVTVSGGHHVHMDDAPAVAAYVSPFLVPG